MNAPMVPAVVMEEMQRQLAVMQRTVAKLTSRLEEKTKKSSG